MKNEEYKTKSCIGCGYCCFTAQCVHSMRKYGMRNKCPALSWDAKMKMYRCLLIADEPRLRADLAIGEGCSSSMFNSWRQDVKFRG